MCKTVFCSALLWKGNMLGMAQHITESERQFCKISPELTTFSLSSLYHAVYVLCPRQLHTLDDEITRQRSRRIHRALRQQNESTQHQNVYGFSNTSVGQSQFILADIFCSCTRLQGYTTYSSPWSLCKQLNGILSVGFI